MRHVGAGHLLEQLARTDGTNCTGAVLDRNRLAELRLEAGGGDAADEVSRATWRVGHDEAWRALRPILG